MYLNVHDLTVIDFETAYYFAIKQIYCLGTGVYTFPMQIVLSHRRNITHHVHYPTASSSLEPMHKYDIIIIIKQNIFMECYLEQESDFSFSQIKVFLLFLFCSQHTAELKYGVVLSLVWS